MFVYTGDYDPDDLDPPGASLSPAAGAAMAILGDRCAVQTLTPASAADATSAARTSYVRAAGDDDDSCPDAIVFPGEILETTVRFAEGFDIPCSDYGVGGSGVVKLQVCSSYRSAIDDGSCDGVGPHPSDPDACWCDAIDVPGVTMLSEDAATPTCEPAPENAGVDEGAPAAMPSPYDNSGEMISPFPTPVDEASGANVTPQAPVPEVCRDREERVSICDRLFNQFRFFYSPITSVSNTPHWSSFVFRE